MGSKNNVVVVATLLKTIAAATVTEHKDFFYKKKKKNPHIGIVKGVGGPNAISPLEVLTISTTPTIIHLTSNEIIGNKA